MDSRSYVVAGKYAVHKLHRSIERNECQKDIEKNGPRWGVLEISVPYMERDVLRRGSR